MKGKCQHCNKEILGRTDKKYCSADCRTRAYLERKKESQIEMVEIINKILLKNRMILAEMMGTNKQKTVQRLELIKLGFNFQHFTGIYLNKQGKLYHYIYDFAWMEFSNQEVLLIRK